MIRVVQMEKCVSKELVMYVSMVSVTLMQTVCRVFVQITYVQQESRGPVVHVRIFQTVFTEPVQTDSVSVHPQVQQMELEMERAPLIQIVRMEKCVFPESVTYVSMVSVIPEQTV